MGKREDKKPGVLSRFFKRLASIGFTNWLAIFICGILVCTILMGFYLSVMSIRYSFTSQLWAFTVTVTPTDSFLSIVLNSVVKKSERENCNGDGTGIKYAAAAANGFKKETVTAEPVSADSPPI